MRKAAILFVAFVALGASSARAQVFTSQSAWLAAVLGASTPVDFEGVDTSPAGFAQGPFSLNGAIFDAGFGGPAFVVDGTTFDGGLAGSFYSWGTGQVFSPQGGSTGSMVLTLPGPMHGLAFFYGDNSGGDSFVATLSNNDTFVLPFVNNFPTLQFWGVVDANSFTSATVVTDGVAPVFDDVSWATGSASSNVVPEPATLAMMAGGVVSIGASALRRRKR